MVNIQKHPNYSFHFQLGTKCMAGTNLPEILEMYHIKAIYNLAANVSEIESFSFSFLQQH